MRDDTQPPSVSLGDRRRGRPNASAHSAATTPDQRPTVSVRRTIGAGDGPLLRIPSRAWLAAVWVAALLLVIGGAILLGTLRFGSPDTGEIGTPVSWSAPTGAAATGQPSPRKSPTATPAAPESMTAEPSRRASKTRRNASLSRSALVGRRASDADNAG
jgi:hypothetical protein